MIIVCISGIFPFVVVICLTIILRSECQRFSNLDVESCIPSVSLKPRESILREFAPIWFNGEIDLERCLRNAVIHLQARAQKSGIGACLNFPCGLKSLPVCKREVSDLMRESDFREEPHIETGRCGCQVKLVLQLKP